MANRKDYFANEYVRERRRVMQFMRRLGKRGYYVELEIPPSLSKIKAADIPTKLAVLRRMTPESIYGLGVIDIETGKYFESRPPSKRKESEEKRIAELNRKTKIIMDRVWGRIHEIIPHSYGTWAKNLQDKWITILSDVLNNAILEQGETQVAKRLDENADTFNSICDVIEFKPSKQEEIMLGLTELATILKGRSLSFAEAVGMNTAEEVMYGEI